MTDELKGCPCCQKAACILEVECGDDDNFGGKYIECQNPQCGITSPIIFPCMESVEDKLTAIWNARPSPAISEDDEYCSKREGLCGCTEKECRRHIVVDDALREAVEEGMPCVSCGKPSHRQTPDDADMCHECFGDFNAIEYDLIKSEKQKLEERIRELADESMRFRIEVINLKDLLKRASPYLGYTSAGMKIQAEIETLQSQQSPPDHKLVADAHRGNMKIEGVMALQKTRTYVCPECKCSAVIKAISDSDQRIYSTWLACTNVLCNWDQRENKSPENSEAK